MVVVGELAIEVLVEKSVVDVFMNEKLVIQGSAVIQAVVVGLPETEWVGIRDWRNILWFAGGIALFMYGMYQMGEGLSRLAGGRLEAFLGRVARTPFRAVLAGTGVTAVLQSSSAVTVMVVQFVNADLMGLQQAAGIIMGANIGTCVTAWMLGVPEMSRFLYIAALGGAAILLCVGNGGRKRPKERRDMGGRKKAGERRGTGERKKAGERRGTGERKKAGERWDAGCRKKAGEAGDRALERGRGAMLAGMREKSGRRARDCVRAKDVAGILLGLALLFLGMDGMQAGTAVLAESRTFQQFLMNCSNPLQGVFAGAAATAVLQSSSVSVGILQALSAGGVMRYETAVPVILGQNIGTCVTALLACIGVGARGRVAAAVHLVFNVVGTGIFLFGFYGLHRILEFSFMGRSVGSVGIALIHTVFNLATTAVLLPMLYMYSWGEGQKKRLNSKRVREFSRSVMR